MCKIQPRIMNTKIENNYLEIIKHHFPNISPEDVKAYFQGNDYDVFVVKNEVTFRFPKEKRTIDPKRSQFLKLFSSTSPLALPLINIMKGQKTGIDYEMNKFIPGVSFSPDLAKSFTTKELMTVAKKLGEFLTTLHSFPIDEARKLNIDESDPSTFWQYMEQNLYPRFEKTVFPHIPNEEQIWIQKLFESYISTIKVNPFEVRLIHSDIWVFHIIVDPEKHTLSGLIDFGLRIHDPANDFKAFEYYGSDFVKGVYKNYSMSTDKDFDSRRLFYTGHDEVFELGRWLDRGNQNKIMECKKSLTQYINTHPL